MRRNPKAYGWVAVDNQNRAEWVSVKVPLEGDPMKQHAIIGSFWFRKGRFFVEQAERMIRENSRINQEFYIDQAMNFCIQSGLNVSVFEVDRYVSWGTPEDLKTYEYWQKFHALNSVKPALSVVIPAYNEVKNLPDILERIQKAIEKSDALRQTEWILVDNGSADGSWDYLSQRARELPWLKPVRIEENQGYGNGLLRGLKQAQGALLAWTHADQQTDPEDVFRAWEANKKGAGGGEKVIVKGHRKNRAWVEKFFSFGMQVIASAALGTWVSEVNAQPKLFPRNLFNEFEDAPLDFSIDLYVLYLARRKKYRIIDLPVYFRPRFHGEAKGGGGSLKNRRKLIERTFKYIFQLRKRIREKQI